MKRHLTLATTSEYARDDEMIGRVRGGDGGTIVAETGLGERSMTFAAAPAWRHTLVLKGKLDYHSTPELEEEIECLCQEGVTTLTLDLRQLNAIDSIGAQVIAFRGGICQRRGQDFRVIAGSRAVHRALSRAGATEVLMPEPVGSSSKALFNAVAAGPFADRRTTMAKDL
jgi:anti-anti-sigma factor